MIMFENIILVFCERNQVSVVDILAATEALAELLPKLFGAFFHQLNHHNLIGLLTYRVVIISGLLSPCCRC